MTSILELLLVSRLITELSNRGMQALNYSLVQVGSLSITLLFLIKAAFFLFVLVLLSRLLQSLVIQRGFKHLHIAEAQKFALGRFVTYFFFLIGLFVGLQSLGVNLSSLVVVGGALGVGVGLGLQNVVSNFVAGLILLVEQPIRIGDRIEINNTLGNVVRIAPRSTWIRTNDNIVIVVPNSDFISNTTINWTGNDPTVRVQLPLGVGYNSDVEQVRQILLAVASENPDVLKSPAPDVVFTEYGDSSLNFALRVWTTKQTDTPTILKSNLYFAIWKVFKEKGIEVPFPQRDLNIRSSDIPLPFGGKSD